MTRGEF